MSRNTPISPDLFLDALIDAPVKDDRALMEFPFFWLATPRETDRTQPPLSYKSGNVEITVSPSSKGFASIWDKDVLVYAVSLINQRIERGEEPSRTIRFPAHDFLVTTSRGTGKRAYELFLDALFRLRGTTIQTNIAAAEQTERRGFGWIETFRVIEDAGPNGKRRMKAVEITVCDWMFRAIVNDRRVLTINRDYFRIRGGIERRLYELARKHCGRQQAWKIGLPKLAEKVGTSRTLRKFKADLKRIIEADSIPDYTLELLKDPNGEVEKAMREDGIFDLGRMSNDRVIVCVRPKPKAAEIVNLADADGA